MTADSSASNGSSSSSNNSPVAQDEDDDNIYRNKQLIAHLLKKVCSQRGSRVGKWGHSANNSNNNNNSNSSNSNGFTVPGNSDSSRSRSPDESEQPPQQQHRSVTASSDYLSTSSASALSLSGQSASPAYISPFALSPLSESSPWSHPTISLAVIKDRRTRDLERIVLHLCDEFEQRLHDRFDNFGANLDTEPASIRESVTHELETLFYDDNVHWGRFIAVFVLAKEICDKCEAEGRPQLSAAVQQWVAEFIDQNLWEWVLSNQGWFGLIKFYRETGGDDRSERTFGGGSGGGVLRHLGTSLMTLSAVSLAVALATAYFRR